MFPWVVFCMLYLINSKCDGTHIIKGENREIIQLVWGGFNGWVYSTTSQKVVFFYQSLDCIWHICFFQHFSCNFRWLWIHAPKTGSEFIAQSEHNANKVSYLWKKFVWNYFIKESPLFKPTIGTFHNPSYFCNHPRYVGFSCGVLFLSLW